MSVEWEATVNDLKDPALEGQIELVDGKMVHVPSHTIGEARTVGNILVSLKRYEDRQPRGSGRTFMRTIVYVIDLPHRKTFSHDVSFAVTRPKNPMDFIPGAPIFAAGKSRLMMSSSRTETLLARRYRSWYPTGHEAKGG
jgi:hypothetical protein